MKASHILLLCLLIASPATATTWLGAQSGRSNGGTTGVYNIKDYGAVGDLSSDDTAAIQAAYNAACAAAVINPSQAPTVYIPAGRYLTSFSIIMNCGTPIMVKGDGEQTSVISGGVGGTGLFPVFYVESPQNITHLGTFTAASLATGAGVSINFPGNQFWYLNLKDATQADNASAPFTNAKPINGMAAISVELFAEMTATGAGRPIDKQFPVNQLFDAALGFGLAMIAGATENNRGAAKRSKPSRK